MLHLNVYAVYTNKQLFHYCIDLNSHFVIVRVCLKACPPGRLRLRERD